MMQQLLADHAISMSEFKKNPAAVLREAAGRPVAVLNHNRVGFYLLEPYLLEALLDELTRLQPVTTDTGQSEPVTDTRRAKLMAAFLSQAKTSSD